MLSNTNYPTRNGVPWLYCAKCGAQMKWHQTNDGYDRTTGEFGPNYAWRCPKWVPNERSRTHDVSNTTVRDLKNFILEQ